MVGWEGGVRDLRGGGVRGRSEGFERWWGGREE